MPLVIYSVLRLALFGVAVAALAAAHMGGWLLVVVAAFAAWALSYVLLAGPRDAAALWLAQRSARRASSGARFSPGVESDAVAEDAEASTSPAAAPRQVADDGTDASGSDGDVQSESPRPSSAP